MKKYLLIISLLASCKTPEPVTPDYIPYSCDRICTVLQDHNCLEGKPTKKGATCFDICEMYRWEPIQLQWSDISNCTTLECIKLKYRCEGGW